MTDTPTAPVDAVLDPEAVLEALHGATVETADHGLDDGPDNRITFVRSGLIRVVIDGETFVLRRPFFGELVALRGALEELTDTIDAQRVDALAHATELERRQAEIDDETLEPHERQRRLMELRVSDREVGRRLAAAGEQLRFAWWARVFDTLGTDGRRPDPERYPSWVVDTRLPGQVMRHWRSSPLAPG